MEIFQDSFITYITVNTSLLALLANITLPEKLVQGPY